MKYLLFLLPFSPLATEAQTAKKMHGGPGTMISFNLGYAPDNASQNFSLSEYRGGLIRASLSLLTDKEHVQFGLTIEGGTNSADFWYLAPGVLINRRFSIGHAYFYAGAMAGYTCSDNMVKEIFNETKMAHGYVFGTQCGYVQPLGKHLAFTSELAIRSTQLWQKYTAYEAYYPFSFPNQQAQQPQYIPYERTASYVVVSIPVTVGLRYRF